MVSLEVVKSIVGSKKVIVVGGSEWNNIVKLVPKMIREKFDMDFDYSFNDLYKVKDGVVRRLKGGMSRVDL